MHKIFNSIIPKSFVIIIVLLFLSFDSRLETYWQQEVAYIMNVDMDVNSFKYKGTQKLTYTNHSPDTLRYVFYHLYYNAFQPNSEMDMRLQNIPDPDRRMVNNMGTEKKPVFESRIKRLKPNEMGYLKILNLTQDGMPLDIIDYETIVKVPLQVPLLPNTQTIFEMEFEGQVPLQIRRSGRNSKDKVVLSMTQWYPKMVEYDAHGWHDDPYIAREFHGVWGSFDVKINIDKDYMLAGTGYLQNAPSLGFGYAKRKGKKQKGDKRLWHFKASDVHDFAWAADPDYIHDIVMGPRDVKLHFFYKGNESVQKNWQKIQPKTVEVMDYFNTHIGYYPWKEYSVIQGGDGGMEYAMCTLIAGGKNYESLLGTTIHELAHSWFQHALATSESEYAWMDEGFTSYISAKAKQSLTVDTDNTNSIFKKTYQAYRWLANSGREEPLTTHADRFDTNTAYSIASYIKGQIFLAQLGYVIGEDLLEKTLKSYFKHFKMKHPNPWDFIRVAEKESDLQLGWYLKEWVHTTHTIDYGIEDIKEDADGVLVYLKRIGSMPMPIDLKVTFEDGKVFHYNIPLRMMRGHKPIENKENYIIAKDWSWANPNYELKISYSKSGISSVEIDDSKLLADLDLSNNTLTVEK